MFIFVKRITKVELKFNLMRKQKLFLGAIIASSCIAGNAFAQLTIGTEIRPRAEVRAGYKDLYSETQDPNIIATQRTRLNASFKTEKVKTYISFQNVSIWGEQAKTSTISRTATSSDTSSLTSVAEAWAELNLCKYSTLRVGRQSLSIEDERLLTSGNWGQAGQSLDGLLYNYANDSIARIRVFGSYNNDKDGRIAATMVNTKLKTFNFIEVKKDFNANINVTLLGIFSGALKTGSDYNIYLKNTMGGYVTLKNDELALSLSGFFQNGQSSTGKLTRAYLLNAQLKYTKKPFEVAAGFDLLSGNDMTNTSASYKNIEHKFDVLLGTTRPFQGTMELVNTKTSNAGLLNAYLKTKYLISEFWSVGLNYFMLNTQNAVLASNGTELNKYLGQEVDGMVTYKVNQDVTFDVGYCMMVPSHSLKMLKSATAFDHQNWAWVQLTFKPRLFESALKN